MYSIECHQLNLLSPGQSGRDFQDTISSLALLIGILRNPSDNALRYMPRNLTDDKSVMV